MKGKNRLGYRNSTDLLLCQRDREKHVTTTVRVTLDRSSGMELAGDKGVPGKDGVYISGREWFAFSKCTSRFKGI